MHPHRLAVLAAVSFAALVPALPASAATAREQHCVVEVIDQTPDGELVTGQPTCYGTFAEVQRSVAQPSQSDFSAQSATAFILATHYDGAGFTGSSTSVSGSDCAGGWLNVSSTWNNRISSTRNGCYRVRHFDGSNLTGSWEDTNGSGGTLNSAMNNKTTSIQYLS